MWGVGGGGVKSKLTGAPIRILGGGLEFFWDHYFCGEMGEINKWRQGMVEIQPILRWPSAW